MDYNVDYNVKNNMRVINYPSGLTKEQSFPQKKNVSKGLKCTKISSELNEMEKFLEMADVIIVDPTSKREYPITSQTLKARSQFFASVLSPKWSSSVDGSGDGMRKITSPIALDVDSWLSVYEWLMTGKLSIEPANLISALHIAEVLSCPLLVHKIVKKFKTLDHLDFAQEDYEFIMDARFFDMLLYHRNEILQNYVSFNPIYVLLQTITFRLLSRKHDFCELTWPFLTSTTSTTSTTSCVEHQNDKTDKVQNENTDGEIDEASRELIDKIMRGSNESFVISPVRRSSSFSPMRSMPTSPMRPVHGHDRSPDFSPPMRSSRYSRSVSERSQICGSYDGVGNKCAFDSVACLHLMPNKKFVLRMLPGVLFKPLKIVCSIENSWDQSDYEIDLRFTASLSTCSKESCLEEINESETLCNVKFEKRTGRKHVKLSTSGFFDTFEIYSWNVPYMFRLYLEMKGDYKLNAIWNS